MDSVESTSDVISISSSDDDSDCRIVKVVSSPAKQNKSKMRWQYQPSSLPRARASRKEREKMTIRQLTEAVYDDRRDAGSISRGYAQRLGADSIATRSDTARSGGFQSAAQGIESLRFGSAVDGSSSDMESNNTKTTDYAAMHVDLTDPSSIQHYTADLEPASTWPLPLSQSRGPKLAPREDEDEQRGIRSRSCSTVTLDFTLDRAAAQYGSSKGFEKDIHTLDEPLVTGLVDPASYTPVKTANLQDAEQGAPLLGPTKAEPSWPILQSHRNTTPQPHRGASVTPNGQLPREGKWRAWSSVVNFSAFEAMPGPLFTRQKKVLHSMTYDDMMRERAKKESKLKGHR